MWKDRKTSNMKNKIKKLPINIVIVGKPKYPSESIKSDMEYKFAVQNKINEIIDILNNK